MSAMLNRSTMRQVGVIVFGAGLDARNAIEEAKSRGFAVLVCEGYAELWAESK